METDPKGQLGGLETPAATRKRFALESQTFRCPTCTRTNEVIIKECEEKAAVMGTASVIESEIPSNLKMGWKDEMNGTTVVEHEKPEPNTVESDGESGELAEGFIQTDPIHISSAPSGPVAAPAPRGDADRPVAATQHQPVIVPQQVQTSNGVPPWLDQLIVALFILLVAVVLHRLFSN